MIDMNRIEQNFLYKYWYGLQALVKSGNTLPKDAVLAILGQFSLLYYGKVYVVMDITVLNLILLFLNMETLC